MASTHWVEEMKKLEQLMLESQEMGKKVLASKLKSSDPTYATEWERKIQSVQREWELLQKHYNAFQSLMSDPVSSETRQKELMGHISSVNKLLSEIPNEYSRLRTDDPFLKLLFSSKGFGENVKKNRKEGSDSSRVLDFGGVLQGTVLEAIRQSAPSLVDALEKSKQAIQSAWRQADLNSSYHWATIISQLNEFLNGKVHYWGKEMTRREAIRAEAKEQYEVELPAAFMGEASLRGLFLFVSEFLKPNVPVAAGEEDPLMFSQAGQILLMHVPQLMGKLLGSSLPPGKVLAYLENVIKEEKKEKLTDAALLEIDPARMYVSNLEYDGAASQKIVDRINKLADQAKTPHLTEPRGGANGVIYTDPRAHPVPGKSELPNALLLRGTPGNVPNENQVEMKVK